jgi:hypothetical protein
MLDWLGDLRAAVKAGLRAVHQMFLRQSSEVRAAFFVSSLIFWAGILVPAFVANQTIGPKIITIPLAFLLYIYLWLNAATSGFRALSGLYGWGYPVGSSLIQKTEAETRRSFTFLVIYNLLASFSFTVYGFAVTYVFLSNMRPGSFNVGKLDMFSGIYFSVTTIATVGYGDIVPLTRLARIFVMFEIFAGMLYAVLTFSIVASFLRGKR